MNRPRHGFTLIEVLLATLAMSILLVAVYSIFGQGHRLRNRAEALTRDSRLQARTVNLVRRDLEHALVLSGPIAATLEGDLQGPESRFPGYLRLTTTTGRTQDDIIGSDVQEVEYFIVEEEFEATADDLDAGGGVLIRTVQRILLADVPEPPLVQPLLHQVTAMAVSFYDGDQWLDQWDSAIITNELPLAVRVSLDRVNAEEPDDRLPPLEILVPWLTVPVTNEVEEAETA